MRKKERTILNDIVSFIQTHYPGESGIIYCGSRRACEEVTEKLKVRWRPARHWNRFSRSCQAQGLRLAFYHAGLEKEDRERVQSDWAENRVNIIVATVAFGMGKYRPHIRKSHIMPF